MSGRNLFTEIKAALLGVEAIATIVGRDTKTTKIWNSWERANTYPCLIIEIDSEGENPDLSGKGDFISADVTITARDNTEAGAHTLQEAVRHFLAGYAGAFDAILESTARSATPKNTGDTANWYDQVMAFAMSWTEAV